MAPKQAEAPLDLEQQFEKLNSYINASQHAKAVKQADASMCRCSWSRCLQSSVMC
jgi:hypothetical protein